ncbi:MAG: hypothetical protein GAK45_00620 [Pseudomonas citronellolis]|nr:MAG: hypothetical protein GAK45_00620 [Pseudomonas citronellolis]
MALEIFTWPIEANDEGEVSYRTRTSQFGDGYSQRSSDGLNNRSQSWPVSLVADKAEALVILAFIDRHKGARAFRWTPPLGEAGLYVCASCKPSNLGGSVYRISATFEQVFHP